MLTAIANNATRQQVMLPSADIGVAKVKNDDTGRSK
jgi:hypothetical protein